MKPRIIEEINTDAFVKKFGKEPEEFFESLPVPEISPGGIRKAG